MQAAAVQLVAPQHWHTVLRASAHSANGGGGGEVDAGRPLELGGGCSQGRQQVPALAQPTFGHGDAVTSSLPHSAALPHPSTHLTSPGAPPPQEPLPPAQQEPAEPPPAASPNHSPWLAAPNPSLQSLQSPPFHSPPCQPLHPAPRGPLHPPLHPKSGDCVPTEGSSQLPPRLAQAEPASSAPHKPCTASALPQRSLPSVEHRESAPVVAPRPPATQACACHGWDEDPFASPHDDPAAPEGVPPAAPGADRGVAGKADGEDRQLGSHAGEASVCPGASVDGVRCAPPKHSDCASSQPQSPSPPSPHPQSESPLPAQPSTPPKRETDRDMASASFTSPSVTAVEPLEPHQEWPAPSAWQSPTAGLTVAPPPATSSPSSGMGLQPELARAPSNGYDDDTVWCGSLAASTTPARQLARAVRVRLTPEGPGKD